MFNMVEVYIRLGRDTATEECNIIMCQLSPNNCLDELKVLYNNLRPKTVSASALNAPIADKAYWRQAHYKAL